jgi:hypothetical protein
VRFDLDKPHDLLGHGQGLLAVIGNCQLKQQIGKAHDPQTDLPVPLDHAIDGRQWIAGHIDRIVQKVHRRPDSLLQGRVIDLRAFVRCGHEFGKIDGAQVAGFHGQQRLFAAGIGAFNLTQRGRWVVAVHAIEENDPRIAVFPGLRHQLVIDVAGA